jgi:hypothetical protein
MTLLLTSVFGPYGIDDEYGEKENKMELFHNQVHPCSQKPADIPPGLLTKRSPSL